MKHDIKRDEPERNLRPLYGAPSNLAALGVMKTEIFPQACGQLRAFNSAALAKSFNRLQADLAARMTAHGLKLAPLVYCQ